jgi:NAD(P)-dependent dehydrogenase (short-subunit alcohol dehydrogenase family)
MDITNKVALVTGGASGLGLASVRALQSAGATVVIVDLPSSKGDDVAAEIGATFVAADVTSEEQVGAAIATATGLGPLSVVVNCAGIANARRVVAKDGTVFPLDEFAKIVQVNLVGTFNVIRLAAAAMIESTPVDGEERGVIVNTASVAASTARSGRRPTPHPRAASSASPCRSPGTWRSTRSG